MLLYRTKVCALGCFLTQLLFVINFGVLCFPLLKLQISCILATEANLETIQSLEVNNNSVYISYTTSLCIQKKHYDYKINHIA